MVVPLFGTNIAPPLVTSFFVLFLVCYILFGFFMFGFATAARLQTLRQTQFAEALTV